MKVAPIKKVEELKMPPFEQIIEHILKEDPEYAYHTTRILVDYFGIKEEELTPGLKGWSPKAISLWKKTREALLLLESQGKVKKRREGKINYYWWNGSGEKKKKK